MLECVNRRWKIPRRFDHRRWRWRSHRDIPPLVVTTSNGDEGDLRGIRRRPVDSRITDQKDSRPINSPDRGGYEFRIRFEASRVLGTTEAVGQLINAKMTQNQFGRTTRLVGRHHQPTPLVAKRLQTLHHTRSKRRPFAADRGVMIIEGGTGLSMQIRLQTGLRLTLKNEMKESIGAAADAPANEFEVRERPLDGGR